MSKHVIDSEQNSEQIVKFVIASILLVDAFVLYEIASAFVSYWHVLVGKL